jgi:hypothetical protein
MRREENHVSRRDEHECGEEKVDLIDCVMQDMREMAVSDERRVTEENGGRRPQMNWDKGRKKKNLNIHTYF